MRKLVLDIQDLNFSSDFLGASPLAFGAWVRLSMYCATHMTGGVLEDCKAWDTFKWSRACGLDWAAVTACCEAKLAEWDGMDLHVIGYPAQQEKAYRSKSKGASEARSKRLRKSLQDKKDSDIRVDVSSDITSLHFPSSDSSSISSEEDIGSPSTAPHHEPSQEDHWRMQVSREPWSRELHAAGCKIGPRNWAQWRPLVDEFTLVVVIGAAKSVPATERWPSQVEDALRKSYGQANPGDVVKVTRMVL